MRTYYKIVLDREHELAGAGLGYDELFGDALRYYWDRGAAQRAAVWLNEMGEDETGTYRIVERHCYADGSWDDEGDAYAAEQLSL
jgi:hypothetical protein